MKRKKVFLFVGLVFFVAIVVSFSIYKNNNYISDNVITNKTINIRLKWLWYSGWAGELVAENLKIWEKYGLNAKLQPGGFELDPIKLVASGVDDIGIAGADQILMAREKGIPLVAFAVQYQESPVGFATKIQKQINTINDFKGKNIGVKYGTDIDPVYRTLLRKNNISASEINEIPVKFDLSPFLTGIVDIYPGYLTNDLLLAEEKDKNVKILDARDFGVTVYGNVYFCTEKFLKQNKSDIVNFLKAIKEGWEISFQLEPEYIAKLAVYKNTSLNFDHEVRVARSLKQFVVPNGMIFGTMSHDKWTRLKDLLTNNKIINEEFNVNDAYTFDIINEVLK